MVPDATDAALERRASEMDDAWFEKALAQNAAHPSMPRIGSVVEEAPREEA